MKPVIKLTTDFLRRLSPIKLEKVMRIIMISPSSRDQGKFNPEINLFRGHLFKI